MITLDLSNPTPPYEQIRVQLTGLIRTGVLDAGQKLPSIRQLACDLRIAPGTVARAYKELERDGLIASGRARGTRVLPGQQSSIPLQTSAQQYVRDAKLNGASLVDALGVVRAVWELVGDE